MKNSTPPFSLLQLQTWFAEVETLPLKKSGEFGIPEYDASLLPSIEEYIERGPYLTAAQRIGIYNQQYWWRLYHIMQNHFPGLLRIFGMEAFNEEIAKPYLIKYPPGHWTLHNLGEKLPNWIEEEYNDTDKKLVFQMAVLDAAYQKIWHTPFEKTTGKIAADTHLFLQPSVILLEMSADLIAFRNCLIRKEKDYWVDHPFPEIIKFEKKTFFVLFPENFETLYEKISENEYLILKEFEKGSSIVEALSLYKEELSAENIGRWFQIWAQRKWLFSKKAFR